MEFVNRVRKPKHEVLSQVEECPEVIEVPNSTLYATLRSLKLQILLQFTKYRSRPEQPKPALYHSHWKAILHILPHLIPIASTFALLILNISSTFIGPVSTETLTALQYCAKLIEVLTQASISVIVCGLVRLQLLGDDGFPFGGLLASTFIEGISSLWSLPLWGCLTSNVLRKPSRAIFIALLPAAVVLTVVVGPSTAVLLIPRRMTIPTTTALNLYPTSETDVYPLSLKLDGTELRGQSDFEESILQAFSQAPTGASTQSLTIAGTGDLRNAQLIATEVVSYEKYALNPHTEALATIPTNISLAETGGYRPGLHVSGLNRGAHMVVHTTQPFVQMDCFWSAMNAENDSQLSEYIDFGPNKEYLKGLVSLRALVSVFDARLGTSNMTSSDQKISLSSPSFVNGTLDPHASIYEVTAWMDAPLGATNTSSIMLNAWRHFEASQAWAVSACTVHAYWSRAITRNLGYSPAITDLSLHESSTASTIVAALEEKRLITLDHAWANQVCKVALPAQKANGGSYDGVLIHALPIAMALSYVPVRAQAASQCMMGQGGVACMGPPEDGKVRDQWWKLFDDLIADGLATKYGSIWTTDQLPYPSTFDGLAKAEMKAFKDGYGYNTDNNIVILSSVAMGVYLCAVLSYLSYTIITGTVANSWDFPAEIVSLALNSPQPKDVLHNTSVGIDSLETYRQPVSIRVGEDKSLELVFKNTGKSSSYDRVVPNVRY